MVRFRAPLALRLLVFELAYALFYPCVDEPIAFDDDVLGIEARRHDRRDKQPLQAGGEEGGIDGRVALEQGEGVGVYALYGALPESTLSSRNGPLGMSAMSCTASWNSSALTTSAAFSPGAMTGAHVRRPGWSLARACRAR